uniref:SAC3 domain-containing protein 1 n=1 Tax=Cacopsylla melanoneura TaxID=428564 RepID=A0A8D8X6E1_9HEMI
MSGQGGFVRGTCMDMCPASERILREREHLIHPLEALGDDIHKENALDFASPKSAISTAQSASPVSRLSINAAQSASPIPQPGSRTDILVFGPQSGNTDSVAPRFQSENISSDSTNSRPQSARGRLRALGRPNKKLHFKADRNLMVKCYHRSAAGMELNDPALLRPAPVLIQTVHHLMTRVVKSKRLPWCEVHSFVSDRLRSVRQDANIQQIEPNGYVMILEQCVQFYAYSMYRQCPTHPSSAPSCVDKYLNRKQLEECLHQCTTLYDEYSRTLYTPHEESMPDCRVDLECVYLIVNIDSYAVLHRALSLEKCTPIQSTLQLCLSYSMQNYTRVFHLLPSIPTLAAAVFASLHLPRFRKHCLQIINNGFSCKNNYLPVSYLKKCLHLDTEDQVKYLCGYYGLTVDTENTRVLCSKTDFQKDKTPEVINHNKKGLKTRSLLKITFTNASR